MDNGRYIWCRKCGAIHHVTPFDRYPAYASTGGEVQELPLNDWRDFMACHANHKLEPLTATGNNYFPDDSAYEPMSVGYVEVSNGAETLLLRRSRSSIEEPFGYEVVNGRLAQSEPFLEIQADVIRKEMKLHFSWAPAAPLTDEQITLFVALFRDVVRRIDPHSVRAGEHSCEDDNVSYCKLGSAAIDDLMAQCRRHFPPVELEALRRFVTTHNDDSDVMALVKRRMVTIEPQPK